MAIGDTLGKSIDLFGFKVPAVGVLAAGAVIVLAVIARARGTGQPSGDGVGQTAPANGVTADDLGALSDSIDAQFSGLQSDYAAQLAAVQAGFTSADQGVLSQIGALETSQAAALAQLSGSIPGVIDQRTAQLSSRVTAVEQRAAQIQAAQADQSSVLNKLGKLQRNQIRFILAWIINGLGAFGYNAQQQAQAAQAYTQYISQPANAQTDQYEAV